MLGLKTFHVLVGEMQVRHLTYEVQAPDAESASALVAGDDSWIDDGDRVPDPVLISDEHQSTVNVEELEIKAVE